MDLTYFDTLPQELNYIILFNLDMKDICSVLGYDFLKSHKQFFTKIIKRDFGEYILTGLDDYSLLESKFRISVENKQSRSLFPTVKISTGGECSDYQYFLIHYRNVMKRITNTTSKIEPTLGIQKMDIRFSDLKRIGINIELLKRYHTNEYVYELLKQYDTLSICGMYYKKESLLNKLVIVGILHCYIIEDVSMESLSNLIFFFYMYSIFNIHTYIVEYK